MKSVLKSIRKKCKKVAREITKFTALKVIYPAIYALYKLKPKNEKLVMFADVRDREMLDNFIGLYNICKEKGYQCEYLCGKSFGKSVTPSKRRINKIKFELKFIRLYAQCRTLFLVEWFPLVFALKPREGTDVVQLWHACGAMKVMGYASRGKNWGGSEKEWKRYPIHRYYTLVTVSSESVIPCYEQAFDVADGAVKALGVARTDIYFDKNYLLGARRRILEIFPEIGSRKIILFAPTFRGNSIPKSNFKLNIDYCKLKEHLQDRYVLITKFHPLMATGGLPESMRIQCKNFVFDATKLLTPEEALCGADILVSDYSSLMFEYMLLERPMISFIPDIDQYISDRGFFFPYDETMPGPYVFNEDDLLKKIQTADEWFDVKRIKAYREKYMSACDGHSTQRIFDAVFQK